MDFPLIYCNGDSYLDENFRSPLMVGKTCADVVGSHVNGFVINKAKNGSCNRRIIRNAVHDIILQRETNPTQKIIALIGLTFDVRTELWIDDASDMPGRPDSGYWYKRLPEESQFITHQFSGQQNWQKNLLANIDIDTDKVNNYTINSKKFLDKFSEGRGFFFSSYAERINLLTDLVMFRAVCQTLNVDFLIFQCPLVEKLEPEYLVDFFKKQISDDERFFDLENFGFVNWCEENQFSTIDPNKHPGTGHYGPDAHSAFAKQILIPKLKQLKII